MTKAKSTPKTEEVEVTREQAVVTETETTELESTSNTMDADTAESEDTSDTVAEDRTTKAGKHSKKAQAEEKAETERKAKALERREGEEDDKPKAVATKPNPINMHGKNWRAASELVDRTKQYSLSDAVALAKATSKVKFDASVELHVNLGVDPRQADQMIRGTMVLPAGTGRTIRVAVIAPLDKHEAAKKAGADLVRDESLLVDIESGKLDFDMLVATPDMMPKLGRVAKVLGPKGLMPNPKSGTVTTDVSKAVTEAKAGRVEYRIDKQAIVHLAVGKVSFSDEQLLDNARALINALIKAKPSTAKGTYMKALSMTTTMGPGIKLDTTLAMAESNPKK
jgi:ribosomal protein L1